MEKFKLKVERCSLCFSTIVAFDLFVTGCSHFLLSKRSLSFNNVMITLTSSRSSAPIVELADHSVGVAISIHFNLKFYQRNEQAKRYHWPS